MHDIIAMWKNYLTHNLNYSVHTAISYVNDVTQFFGFMTDKKQGLQTVQNCADYFTSIIGAEYFRIKKFF
jgi:site-specific recombinase XerD